MADPGLVAGRVQALLNLHDGQSAIPDIVRLGDQAVAALEQLLRGPSQSLHHSRCWAADALAAIGSETAVGALLRALADCSSRELTGASLEAEDVVVSTVAEHLGHHPGATVVAALLAALARRAYPGCVRALGRIGCPRAIPLLVECLGEDATRPPAIDALSRFGPLALAELERYARNRLLVHGIEPPSRRDGRIAAARLISSLRGGDSFR